MTELAPGRTGRTGRNARIGGTGTAMGVATGAVSDAAGVRGAAGAASAGGAGRVGGQVPSPATIRPRPVSAVSAVPVPGDAEVREELVRGEQAGQEAGSGRATARAALEAALSGVKLSDGDRRFLSRLSQWDKRNANAVASLMRRVRQRGEAEAEAGLTPAQLEVVLAALTDAFAYRTSGAAAAACWDCASRPTGVCGDHALDADRARSFAAVLTALSGKVPPTPMARLGAVPGFRRRTPVAS